MASGAMASSCARNSGLFRIFSGCTTARPASSAASLTGGAVSWRSRPTGRSGCVTTSAISCSAARSASSVCTAKRGVPQKTSFISLPLAFALHLANLAQVQVALEGAHAEDEQHSVHVVDLMLEAAREHVFAVHLEPFALLILGADAHLGVARHLLVNFGKTETAFLSVGVAVAGDDLGIDEHQLVFGLLAQAHVDG